jgi:hypothetical protein
MLKEYIPQLLYLTPNHFGKLNGIDSFYNASMTLTGMGSIGTMETNAAKLFASLLC